MGNKWQNKYKKVEQEAHARLRYLVSKRGVKSEHSGELCLKIKEDKMMFNLEGGRYLVEVTADRLIDSSGYRYSLDNISLEQLCQILDNA